MDLPYGTMSDDEMRNLPVTKMQTDGFIFLWVTGRAMELGRECLEIWGYERVEEIVWIKTNQLMRLIRSPPSFFSLLSLSLYLAHSPAGTGRTGHWLNHSKEHCIVGRKGNPKFNQHIDTDVLLAEVRETSRKPDELYHICERLCPGGRKIELFGRPHNRWPGWVTVGNQLPGTHIVDPTVDVEKLMAHIKGPCSHTLYSFPSLSTRPDLVQNSRTRPLPSPVSPREETRPRRTPRPTLPRQPWVWACRAWDVERRLSVFALCF